MLRLSMQLHKWIALIVGVQILFWVLGGFVMTAIPIERVRSEHHAVTLTPRPLEFAGVLAPADAARAAGLTPVEAALRATPRGRVWAFKLADGTTRPVDARTGRPLPAFSADEARRLAAQAYRGSGRPVETRLLPEAPQETGKTGPLWRVDFDDAEGTAFYLDPATGEVASRRSDVWRFYDFFWRLHILDFGEGDDFNHPTLIAAALLSLAVVVTGFILLWIKLGRDWRSARARRAATAARP